MRFALIIASLVACDRAAPADTAEYHPPPIDPPPREGTVLIPAGWFWTGWTRAPNLGPEYLDRIVREHPPVRVWGPEVDLDVYLVSVDEYKQCVAAGKCTALPTEAPGWSPALVVADQATEYCVSRGGDIPSEPDWEHAARGTDEWIYPWGDRACTPGTCPDASPYDVRDLNGEYAEWSFGGGARRAAAIEAYWIENPDGTATFDRRRSRVEFARDYFFGTKRGVDGIAARSERMNMVERHAFRCSYQRGQRVRPIDVPQSTDTLIPYAENDR